MEAAGLRAGRKTMVVSRTLRCLDCGTKLSQEPWAAGLCPHCLVGLALAESSAVAAELDELETEATLKSPSETSPRRPPHETLAAQEILGERYQVRSLLGRGGMGEVWRAYDLKLRVDVALKALRTELLQEARALETLRQEVRVAREVISPNVCRVFDLQELDGQELISMEYVDGTTLQEILKERGPLELDEAREIASQFLAGLEAIHEAGLVHRDIKPENLMVTRTGRVVVMDFGIAKGLQEGKGGVVAGTPAYMSPEQARGAELDARGDLFSAGVVLAEMVEPGGMSSFEDRRRLWEGIHQESPRVSETPWSKVIAKAVSRECEERFASAAALARALEEVTLRAAGDEDVRPYPGLSAFQEEDARFFFGRELEVEALWKKLKRAHLFAVIGPSGAGKSSFLRAGLLPTLTNGWRAIVATPGNRPFSNLARQLAPELGDEPEIVDRLLRFEELDVAVELLTEWRRQEKYGLVIVDQFEELFTQNSEEVQQRFAEFLGRLPLEADVHVLLSMRGDFLDHCHGHQALQPILSDITLLGPPTGASLRRAIVEPALRCGYQFEEESIVEEMLAEVEGERGALPMVAFAAAQLWEKRDRDAGLLTQEAYEQIGGVGGALAQHAETTLSKIGQGRIAVVRELFRNLVTADGTRAARDRDELLSVFGTDVGAPLVGARAGASPAAPRSAGAGGNREAATDVLDTLIDGRLLTSYDIPVADGADTAHHRIEIVHESLLTHWPRLVRWQMQDAEGAQLRDELRHQARLWQKKGRPEDLLWTGTAFREFQLWRERYPGGVTATEKAFTQAMTTYAQRRRRRRRIAVAVAFATLLAVVGAIGTMWHRSETARQEEERARREAVGAQLLSLGRLRLEEFPSEALAYALASLEEADSQAARLFALDALWRGPTALVLKASEFDGINRLRLSPDAQWLATLGMRNGAVIWSQEGGPTKTLRGADPEGILDFGAWHPDTEIFVTWHNKSGKVRFWSIPEAKEIHSWDLEGATEWTGFHLRGSRLLGVTRNDPPPAPGGYGVEQVSSWPLEGGEPQVLGRWEAHQVTGSDIDPAGSWLAYAEGDLVLLRRLDALESSPPRVLGRHPDEKVGVRFHPRGDRLATGGESGEVRIWSLDGEGERPLRTLRGEGSVRNLALDPQDRWLAAGATQAIKTLHAALLWNLEDPPDAEPIPLADLYGWNLPMAFDPVGRWLLVPQWNYTIFWALSDRYPRILRGQEPPYITVAFAPDGRSLASTSDDGTVRLWPLSPAAGEGVQILHQDPTATFRDIQWAPEGDHLLVRSFVDGRIFVLPLSHGKPRVLQTRTTVPGAWVDTAMFDLEGRRVAIALGDRVPDGQREIRIWDLTSGDQQTFNSYVDGEECPDSTLGSGFVSSMHFLPDGRLLTAGTSGVRAWDLEQVTSTRLLECRENAWFSLVPVGDGGEFLFLLYYLPVGGGSATDQPTELFMLDPESGSTRLLISHGTRVRAVAAEPSGALVVTGDDDGVVRIGPRSGEEPHLLVGHTRRVFSVAVSPDGRWIASASQDGTIRLWPTPDMDKPPFHTLPYEEILAKLRSLTNLRVVEDEGSATGYRIDVGPFPGWSEVPTW